MEHVDWTGYCIGCNLLRTALLLHAGKFDEGVRLPQLGLDQGFLKVN